MLALVTGANRGLGLMTTRSLLGKGWRVIMAVRDEEGGRRVASSLGKAIQVRRLDVADPKSFPAFAAGLSEPLDALVNNAGIYRDKAERILSVNVRGPLALTDALAPRLAENANVVMVSSGLGSLDHFTPDKRKRISAAATREELQAIADEFLEGGGTWPNAYTVSKALLNAVARILAKELKARQIKVNAVDPGWVRTRMGGSNAPRSLEQGASGIVWAATLPVGGPSGGVFHDGERVDP